MSSWQGAPSDLAPWLILGACATGLGLLSVVWLGGTLGALATGAGLHTPPFSGTTLTRILTDGPRPLWPRASPAAIWSGILTTLLAFAAGSGWTLWWARRWWRRPSGLATGRDMIDLTAAPMAQRALRLRSGLQGKPGEADLGYRMARHGRNTLYASWEDTLLAVMGPRSGKTAAIAAPTILRAPGPVMVTSIRPDIYTLTATSAARRGTVWALDPQGIAHLPRTWWWDMLAGARTYEAAYRLAGHFIALKGDPEKVASDFWLSSARSLLTGVFLAAVLSGSRLDDVLYWLATPADQTPFQTLATTMPAVAEDLKSRTKTAPETREGIYQTAREAVSCLLDPEIAAWITPHPDLPRFDPEAFVTSNDTLYLLAKKGTAGAAGVVAALADAVLKAAEHAAERSGGRLDPPLMGVLDEAANVCRISDLADTYTYCGGMGIVLQAIIQNYPQGEGAWGKGGMASLWSTATHVLIGAGINDPKLAQDLSKLIGSRDLPVRSISHGHMGRSVSTNPQQRPVLPPDKIRALPKMHAVLQSIGHPAAYVHLIPWFTDPSLAHVHEEIDHQDQALTKRAQHTIHRPS